MRSTTGPGASSFRRTASGRPSGNWRPLRREPCVVLSVSEGPVFPVLPCGAGGENTDSSACGLRMTGTEDCVTGASGKPRPTRHGFVSARILRGRRRDAPPLSSCRPECQRRTRFSRPSLRCRGREYGFFGLRPQNDGNRRLRHGRVWEAAPHKTRFVLGAASGIYADPTK